MRSKAGVAIVCGAVLALGACSGSEKDSAFQSSLDAERTKTTAEKARADAAEAALAKLWQELETRTTERDALRDEHVSPPLFGSTDAARRISGRRLPSPGRPGPSRTPPATSGSGIRTRSKSRRRPSPTPPAGR